MNKLSGIEPLETRIAPARVIGSLTAGGSLIGNAPLPATLSLGGRNNSSLAVDAIKTLLIEKLPIGQASYDRTQLEDVVHFDPVGKAAVLSVITVA